MSLKYSSAASEIKIERYTGTDSSLEIPLTDKKFTRYADRNRSIRKLRVAHVNHNS
ncbi:MAG: hypothetical protein IJQ82_16095 [Selenomonadaceae bacterium]|nr:hypothetical protein [Selenomonadaceae bacterium]